jgi:hypothetical protein
LAPPICITKTQGLYPNTLEGLAIFIHNATSDRTQWHKPKRNLVELLPWSQSQIRSLTGRRDSTIDLPRKSIPFHPQAIGSGRQLKSEMAFHVRVRADR